MSITHHIAVILIVFYVVIKALLSTVFFHTDYDDQHITALEHFLADILDSNQILPSCSDPGLIFLGGLN